MNQKIIPGMVVYSKEIVEREGKHKAVRLTVVRVDGLHFICENRYGVQGRFTADELIV